MLELCITYKFCKKIISLFDLLFRSLEEDHLFSQLSDFMLLQLSIELEKLIFKFQLIHLCLQLLDPAVKFIWGCAWTLLLRVFFLDGEEAISLRVRIWGDVSVEKGQLWVFLRGLWVVLRGLLKWVDIVLLVWAEVAIESIWWLLWLIKQLGWLLLWVSIVVIALGKLSLWMICISRLTHRIRLLRCHLGLSPHLIKDLSALKLHTFHTDLQLVNFSLLSL